MARNKYVCKFLVALFATFSLSLLSGCGSMQSGSKADAPQQPDPPLPKAYHAVFIDVIDAAPEIQRDYPDASGECKSNIIQALQEKKTYGKVGSKPAGGTYPNRALLIKAKITDMRIVSGWTRFFSGVFSGGSHMDIDVRLVEAATNEIVREKTFSSSNNAWAATWSNGANDRSIPSDMGKIIAEYVNSVMPAN